MEVLGQSVHCEDRGAGVPTLFLHGNPDTSRIWSTVIGRLQDRYRCIAPDLPGFGRSGIDLNAFDFSLDGLARWVEAVLNVKNIAEPVNLVVHDVGGFFGLAWAVKHPEQVRALAITNTIFQPDYRWHVWGRIWRTPFLGEVSMRMFSVPILGRLSARLSMKQGSRKLPLAEIDRTFDEFVPPTRAVVLRLYRATDPENFAAWEPRMVELNGRLRSMVIWGDHDPYIQKRFAARFGAREVVHLPDCGHWVPSEEPEVLSQHLSRLFH